MDDHVRTDRPFFYQFEEVVRCVARRHTGCRFSHPARALGGIWAFGYPHSYRRAASGGSRGTRPICGHAMRAGIGAECRCHSARGAAARAATAACVRVCNADCGRRVYYSPRQWKPTASDVEALAIPSMRFYNASRSRQMYSTYQLHRSHQSIHEPRNFAKIAMVKRGASSAATLDMQFTPLDE